MSELAKTNYKTTVFDPEFPNNNARFKYPDGYRFIARAFLKSVDPVIPTKIYDEGPINGIGHMAFHHCGEKGGYCFTGTIKFDTVNPRQVSVYTIADKAFYESTLSGFDFSGLDYVNVNFGSYVFTGSTINYLRLPLLLTTYSSHMTAGVTFINPIIDLSYLTNLKSINSWSFENTNITSIKLPISVDTIDWTAFTGTKLNTIYLPNNKYTFINSFDINFFFPNITVYTSEDTVYTYDGKNYLKLSDYNDGSTAKLKFKMIYTPSTRVLTTSSVTTTPTTTVTTTPTTSVTTTPTTSVRTFNKLLLIPIIIFIVALTGGILIYLFRKNKKLAINTKYFKFIKSFIDTI